MLNKRLMVKRLNDNFISLASRKKLFDWHSYQNLRFHKMYKYMFEVYASKIGTPYT